MIVDPGGSHAGDKPADHYHCHHHHHTGQDSSNPTTYSIYADGSPLLGAVVHGAPKGANASPGGLTGSQVHRRANSAPAPPAVGPPSKFTICPHCGYTRTYIGITDHPAQSHCHHHHSNPTAGETSHSQSEYKNRIHIFYMLTYSANLDTHSTERCCSWISKRCQSQPQFCFSGIDRPPTLPYEWPRWKTFT